MMSHNDACRELYKVAPRAAWQDACRDGVFRGSADDVRDGFIHLSSHHQLAGTLERHFKGQSDLVLISFRSSDLGVALKWEPSRNGDLFPHLYSGLPTGAARSVHELTLDAQGVPQVPLDVAQ